jgi:hypothetical protein
LRVDFGRILGNKMGKITSNAIPTDYQLGMLAIINQYEDHVFSDVEFISAKRMMRLGWVLPRGGGTFELTTRGKEALHKAMFDRCISKVDKMEKMMRIRFTRDAMVILCRGIRTIVKYYQNQEVWLRGYERCRGESTNYIFYLHDGSKGKGGKLVGVPKDAFTIVEMKRDIDP